MELQSIVIHLLNSWLNYVSFVLAPLQRRYAHTDVRVPDYTDYRRPKNSQATEQNEAAIPSKMFSYVMTSGKQ